MTVKTYDPKDPEIVVCIGGIECRLRPRPYEPPDCELTVRVLTPELDALVDELREPAPRYLAKKEK